MINNIQDTFSIQDLEVLSGIKAHTIRIWEKRYELFNPTRLNRNIRVYNLLDLQKLLNVSFLQKHNYKISKLAKLTERELEENAKSISLKEFPSSYYINPLVVSMFSLDDELFEETYRQQSKKLSFEEIYTSTYLPLLQHVGVLWQTKGVTPAQEHFISNLIYQKIVLNIANIKKDNSNAKQTNILFLPKGEVHEIGLLFMLYRLKLTGAKTIYLGRDIPASNLHDINAQFKKINWISFFTIDRTEEEKKRFISEMEGLLEHTKNTCWVVGNIWKDYLDTKTKGNIKFYEGFHQINTT